MKIHHTRGLYPNGDFKDNGVRAENLESHIDYNRTFRPGRALLVDGKCVLKGSCDPRLIKIHEKRTQGIVPAKDTAPYH
jgi:hypothetical protein